MKRLASLFRIASPDLTIQRKGRILQVLVVALSALGLVYTLLVPLNTDYRLPLLGAQLVGSLLLAASCLRLVSNGRIRFATHFFFATQTIIQALILFSGLSTETFAYFMVVNIVTVAILDAPRFSSLYAVAVIATVYIYSRLTAQPLSFFIGHAISTLGISLATWLAADQLLAALTESQQLTVTLNDRTERLIASGQQMERRARQLQLSAEVGQQTSTNLDLDQLLKDTTTLIRDQFGYYFVAVYLPDVNREHLVLREATGTAGDQLKTERFRLPMHGSSVVCWAANHRTPRIVHDVTEDPVYMMVPLLRETQSEIALPLLARDTLLGVLDVQSRELNAFHEEDVAILQLLANQIGANIDNAQLFAETEARLSEIESLYNLNTLLMTTLDVGEIYRRAAQAFADQLGVDRCTLYSWQAADNTITQEVDFSTAAAANDESTFNLQRTTYALRPSSNTQRVLQTMEPLLHHQDSPDISPGKQQRLRDFGQRTCLEIPLVRGIEAIGLVELYRTADRPPFQPADVQFALAMANQVATALSNASIASESRARVAQLSMLNRISTGFALAPTLKTVFDGARREILSLVDATGLSIVLLAEDRASLHWIFGYEYGQEVDLSTIPPLPITRGFSGYVARNRETLHINRHMAQRVEEFQSTTVGAVSNSWLGLPLIVANELIGVVAVENAEDNDAFTPRDIELLQIIAGPLAITINNLIQFERVQAALAAQSEQRVQLQTAAEVAAAASSILDQQALISRAVALIKERFDLYYVGLFLIDAATQMAVLRAGTDEAGQIQLARRHQLAVGGRSLIGGATADGRNRITQDVTQDDEWRPNPVLPDTRSELALPLKVRGRIIGALTVQSTQPNAFSPELIATLQTMSDQLAVAIENAQLLATAEATSRREIRLKDVSTQMYRSGDIQEIVRTGLQAISETLGGTNVHVRIGAPNGRSLPMQEEPDA